MLYVFAMLMAMCCTLIASSTLKLASVGIETVRILVELVQSCEDTWKRVRCVPRTEQSSKTGVSGDGCPSAATEVKMVSEGGAFTSAKDTIGNALVRKCSETASDRTRGELAGGEWSYLSRGCVLAVGLVGARPPPRSARCPWWHLKSQ